VTDLERFKIFAAQFLTTEDGKPLVIEPFQELILADYFDGCRETVVIVGKKNGKSSLLGAVAIFHLLTVPEAECVIVASSRDQAGIILRQVQGYVRRSEALRARLRVVQREVRHEASGGRIRVLASDSDTLDGQIPTLALVDELARTKTEEAYGLLRDGLGPREGQLIAISTAGDDEESLLGRLRAAAHAMRGFARDGAYKHVRRGGFSWHEWSLDPGDDINDLELLLSCNPASWIDANELRARRDSPSTQPWQLARFSAGLWVAGEDAALSAKEWEACRDPDAEIPDGAKGVVVGGDLGYREDTSAFVAAWRLSGRRSGGSQILGFNDKWACSFLGCGELTPNPTVERNGRKLTLCDEHADWDGQTSDGDPTIILSRPVILKPPGNGEAVDVEDMVEACLGFARRYPGCSFAFDEMAGGEFLLQRLERELGNQHEFVSFPQRTGKLCNASMRFAELVSAGNIRHPGDERFTDHVLTASARYVGEHWRFARPKGKRKPIDALTAAMIAVDVVASTPPPRRSVYEERFLPPEASHAA
jgi:phage terminase large subunit-like protein